MFTLQRIETHTQEIKKSRFLAVCGPVASEQAARDFIAEHSDLTASHNCWAFRIGQIYRFNDDGEPSGTAGKPILQAIDGQSLDHVAVVVTRWFGGTLLGSGGLIRAYGGTAAMCLRAAEKMEVIETVRGTVICDFSDLALIKARLGRPRRDDQRRDVYRHRRQPLVANPQGRAADRPRPSSSTSAAAGQPSRLDD